MANGRNAVVAAVLVLAVAAVTMLVAAPSSAPPNASAPVVPSSDGDKPSTSKVARRTHAPTNEAAAPEAAPALPDRVDLAVVDRDLDLHGVVVKKDGSPIGGAVVQTVSAPWERAMTVNFDARDFEIAGSATKSAVDGTFRLRLRRAQDVRLRVAVEGFATVDLPHRQAGERVRVVLEPGVRLVVKTVDETGSPLAGLPVRLFRHEMQGDPMFRRTSVTGSDGTCPFDGLPGGCKAYVECLAAGRAPVEFLSVDVPASGEATVDVKIAAGRTLRGRVTDVTNGSPVAGARVGIGWTLDAAVAVAADGTFVLPGWPEKGSDEVHVVAAGYGRAQVSAGTSEYLEIALQRGFEVDGRIVDPAGAPVADACVSVIASVLENSKQKMSMGHATTDASGNFRVADLVRAMPHRLIVVAQGHARLNRKLDLVAADAKTIDLGDVVLQAPRAIEGRVVTPAGEPIARMPLELWGPDDKDYFHYGLNEDRVTDDLGRFRFPDMPPGGYTLSTKQRGASETVARVQLSADADCLDVVMTVDPGTEIAATVVDDAGDPLEHVYVMAFGGDGMSPGKETDASGVARLTIRGKGLQLRASTSLNDARALVASPMHELQPGERDVRFVLPRGARIGGTVVDPDGKPIAGAVVELRPRNPSVGVLPADDAGRFSAVVPLGSNFSVVFDGSIQRERMSASPFVGRIDEVAPGTTDLVLKCARVALDRTLIVKLAMPDGSPATGARVFAMTSTGNYPPTGAMDAEGRVKFAALPAKELSVMAWPAGDWLGPLAVQVVPSGQEIVLTMRRGLPVVGTVVDADGKPVKGAYVHVYTGSTMHQGNDTKEDGSFHLLVPADDPGPFRVEVQFRAGMKNASAKAENVVPGSSPLRVVLDSK